MINNPRDQEGYSKEWDILYKKNLQISRWPWTDLVIYVMRYAKPTGPEFRVLELGCGSGANIPFFLSLGTKYYAIEGSEEMTQIIKERFPSIKNNIICGDFTQDFPFEKKFNLIVDRCSLTHNSTESIKKVVKNIQCFLVKNGKFIGIDWFSNNSSEFSNGKNINGDSYTKIFDEGYFAGLGKVHFSDVSHISKLFKDFKIEILELKTIEKKIPNDNYS